MAELTRSTTDLIEHHGDNLETYLDTLRSDLDNLQAPGASGIALIDNYTSLVSGGDWTAAINAALATGLTTVGLPGTVYQVNGILNSKGQKILGDFSLSTSRYSLGTVKAQTVDPDDLSLRMLYVESAYDLAELLHIRALGFNTIMHYGSFPNNGSIDAAGTIQQMVDNARTAGLNVIIGTDNDVSRADLAAYVASVDSKPNVIGYSVFDEPASHGITIAQQDTKIAQMRAMTNKTLSFVDLVASGAPFVKRWSDNYDLAFVDSYSRHWTDTSDTTVWYKRDIAKMQLDFGTIKAHTKLSRVIPVVATFTDQGGYYSANKAQVIKASRVFAKVCEGNWGAFVWDGHGDGNITNRVRVDEDFKSLCKEINAQQVRNKVVTEAYLFGGTPSDGHWPLTDILSKMPVKDPFSTDAHVWQNAYPVRVKTGSGDTDRTTTLPNSDYSGIGFKNNIASLLTTIKARKHVRCYLEYFNIIGGTSGSFSLFTTNDNGYNIILRYNDALSGNKVLDFDATPNAPEETLIFRIENSGDTTPAYRKFLRGLVVVNDWNT